MAAIGIDFGTTNSVVAVHTKSGVDVLPIDQAPPSWAPYGFDNVFPSVMAKDEASRLCFGWEAKQKRNCRGIPRFGFGDEGNLRVDPLAFFLY